MTTPADPSIAVGPNDVVEAVNSALQVTTRTGAGPVRMNISVMIKNTSGWNVRYPRVVFDPTSGLFILTVLQFNPVLTGCGSQVAVMVSQANPAFPWTSRGTINIDPERLLAYNLSADNVIQALSAGNTISPSGNIRTTTSMPLVPSNAMVIQPAELGQITVKPGVLLRDVVPHSECPSGAAVMSRYNWRNPVVATQYSLFPARREGGGLARRSEA